MRQNPSRGTAPRPSVVLHELAELPAPGTAVPGRDQFVFVTNAVRRRGGLRARAQQHRPVLAAVLH